jgi:hypothetical protein
VAIHPGIVHTHLATGFFQQTGHTALPFMKALVAPVLNCLYPLLLRTPESSAEAMLIAATAPAGKVAGRYMHNDRLSRPDKVSVHETGVFAEEESVAKGAECCARSTFWCFVTGPL